MSDNATPSSPQKKPNVAPAHKAGGMRVGNPHPHPHPTKEEGKKELTEEEKKQAAHDALALSNQLFEIDAVSGEDLKHSNHSKAFASHYSPPEKAISNQHKQYGKRGQVNQPGGAHACNNYLH